MNPMVLTFAAAAAVAGLGFVLMRPQWVFVLVLAMFPMEQLLQAYLPALVSHPAVVNIGVGMLAVFGVITRLGRREPVMSGAVNAVSLLTFALYVLWAFGVTYTPAQEVARENLSRAFPYQVLYLLLLPLLLADVADLRRMLSGLMVLGSAIAVLIMVNPSTTYSSGRLTVELGVYSGSSMVRGNPLALGELGAILAIVAVLLRVERATFVALAVRITAFVTGMAMAITSGSRGQVMGAAVTGVLFFPLARRVKNPRQFFVTVAALAVVIIGLYASMQFFIGEKNRARWETSNMMRDVNARFTMASELLTAYGDSPGSWLFGLGTSAYSAIGTSRFADYVHNVPIEVLCEHGLVGFGIFSSIFVLTIWHGRRLWLLYRDDPPMRATISILLACGFVSFLLSLKQGSVASPAPFYWWLLITKLSMHERKMAQWQADELSFAADDDEGEAYGVLEPPDEFPPQGDEGYALAR